MTSHFKVIGVTGGIASGKSTLAKVLVKLGATLVDADKLGHKCYEIGTPCFDEITSVFGDIVVDDLGNIDRKALGNIVFSDATQMKCLTDICWPNIRKMLEEEITKARCAAKLSKQPSVFVFEAAVLIEAKWMDLADEIWVTHVSRDIAIQRLQLRNSLSAENAATRVDAQISNEERLKHATVEFHNEKDLSELEKFAHENMKRIQSISPIQYNRCIIPPTPPTNKQNEDLPIFSTPPKNKQNEDLPIFSSIEEEMKYWKEEQRKLVAAQTARRAARWDAADRKEASAKKVRMEKMCKSESKNDFLNNCPEAHICFILFSISNFVLVLNFVPNEFF